MDRNDTILEGGFSLANGLNVIWYFVFGRSPIPAQLRLMFTAGGVAAYLVFLVLGLVAGG
jgi:hypothetical protein